jgi:glycosyltransferase involved in cell wall biosynthesis
LPPPYGGIASIVELLKRGNFDDVSISVVETTLQSSGSLGRIFAGFRMLARVTTAMLQYRPAGALCFAGAFRSFWEKTTWAAIGRLFGVRTAVVMVDGNFPRFEKSLTAFSRGMLSRRLARFYVVGVQSQGWLEYFRGLAPDGRYSIVAGGVDTDIFSPAAVKSGAAVVRILYVGWMIEDKGIYELIAAAGKLLAQGQRFQLKLIGPLFDQGPRLRQAIAAHKLEDAVEIVGTISHRGGLIEEYQAADLFVLPSYAEGFPNSILEAMSVGLPVIATNVGGVPEIVQDGVTGILVPPRDSDALTAAMKTLMDDETARQAMGMAARSRILSHHTLGHSIATYRRIFQLLTERMGNEQLNDRVVGKEKCVE